MYRFFTYLSPLVLLFVLAGCAEKPVVNTMVVDNRRLEVSFTERAETILRQEYPIAMPVNGRIDRIDLEEGDSVEAGETLVSIDPVPARQEVEARQAGVEATRARQDVSFDVTVEQAERVRAGQRVRSLQARMAQIGPARDAAETALANAIKEADRVRNLVENGALPSRELERATQAVAEAEAALASRQAEAQVLEADLAEARAALAAVEAALRRKLQEAEAQAPTIAEARARREQAEYTLGKTKVVSPIDGVVLERFERGPVELPAGAPLLALGRLSDLEAGCDVLSQDALRISRGTPVLLDAGEAFEHPIRGEVRLKEPQGFTKRSSLGVEQQRVNVRIGLLEPPEGLGVGYELWARFLVEQKTTLTLPRSCFIRQGDGYFVWRVNGGALQRVAVEVGLKGDNLWEITGPALRQGDVVVSSPDESLTEGQEVETEPLPEAG